MQLEHEINAVLTYHDAVERFQRLPLVRFLAPARQRTLFALLARLAGRGTAGGV